MDVFTASFNGHPEAEFSSTMSIGMLFTAKSLQTKSKLSYTYRFNAFALYLEPPKETVICAYGIIRLFL